LVMCSRAPLGQFGVQTFLRGTRWGNPSRPGMLVALGRHPCVRTLWIGKPWGYVSPGCFGRWKNLPPWPGTRVLCVLGDFTSWVPEDSAEFPPESGPQFEIFCPVNVTVSGRDVVCPRERSRDSFPPGVVEVYWEPRGNRFLRLVG